MRLMEAPMRVTVEVSPEQVSSALEVVVLVVMVEVGLVTGAATPPPYPAEFRIPLGMVEESVEESAPFGPTGAGTGVVDTRCAVTGGVQNVARSASRREECVVRSV